MMLLAFFIIACSLSISIVLLRNKSYAKVAVMLFSAVYIGLTVHCWINLQQTELSYFTYDSMGVLLMTILAVLMIPTIYHGFIYTANDTARKHSIYHGALIALITCMTGAYLANGMTALWVFVEATTLAVGLLIYHDRTETALEATWKYVFICSVGIALAYLGILFLGFIYGRSDAASLNFTSLIAISHQADPLYLKIAFVFVLVGYSTKMGLFPMHTVTIDAHSVAPPPISAMISTALMNVGFLAIFRVYTTFSSSPIFPFMNNILIFSGVLSLLVAAGYMLKAKHLKRMLAYSSLENMGLVAIAIGIGGVGYYAAVLLIVLHTLTKSSLFYQMDQLHRVLRTYKIDECGNYIRSYPAGALVLLIGMFCILAIPPSGLFISEILMIKAMIFGGNWFVLIVSLVFLCCIIYAMIVRILHVVFSGAHGEASIPSPGKVNSFETLSQFVLIGMVIIMCFYRPPFLVDLINQSIAMLPK
jgi:hydrogenase-4 component F